LRATGKNDQTSLAGAAILGRRRVAFPFQLRHAACRVATAAPANGQGSLADSKFKAGFVRHRELGKYATEPQRQ
jgi:hypothetical protein